MAAKKAKKRSSTKRGSKVTGVAKTPDEMQKARNKVVNLIVDQSAEMAARVVRSVSERGTLAALKFLWEVAGLFPAPNSGEEDEDESGMSSLEKLGLDGDIPEDDAPADVESGESQAAEQ